MPDRFPSGDSPTCARGTERTWGHSRKSRARRGAGGSDLRDLLDRRVDDLPDGEAKGVDVEGRKVLLAPRMLQRFYNHLLLIEALDEFRGMWAWINQRSVAVRWR